MRHIVVNQLWIQDRVARGDLTIEKANGKENIADILTKHVNAEDIRVHLHKTGQAITQGRHSISPEDNEAMSIVWAGARAAMAFMGANSVYYVHVTGIKLAWQS